MQEQQSLPIRLPLTKWNTALGGYVEKVGWEGAFADGWYTTNEKNKLAGIAAGANKTVVEFGIIRHKH